MEECTDDCPYDRWRCWRSRQYRLGDLWRSRTVLAPFVILLVVCCCGLRVCSLPRPDCKSSRRPFLPRHISCEPPDANTRVQLFCALYYVPFYFTAVRFASPTHSGLNIFPVTCLLLPGSIGISLLTTRLGKFRWSIWLGWTIAALGCGLLRFFDQDTKTAVWAVILGIFGIGHGILLTSVNVGIQAISHVEDAGRAAAMYAFMRTLGMAIGVAIGGTVFQNLMIKKLNELGLPDDIAHNSEVYVRQMAEMAPDDPARVGALEACKCRFSSLRAVQIKLTIA